MKFNLSLLTCSALIAGASIANAATVVNVNFGATKTEADLTGPIGSTGETWNQAGTAKSDTALTDSAGGATDIDWAFSGPNFTNAGNWNSATTEEMLESAFFANDANARSLTISGLDAGKTYDLYIASFDQDSWGNAPMSFTTTNESDTAGAQVASNEGPDDGEGGTLTGGSPWTLGMNYVLFEGIVPNGSDAIVIAGVKTAGDYGMWNGFQLVGTPVPEPSTFALLAGMFSLTWIMLRRRT